MKKRYFILFIVIFSLINIVTAFDINQSTLTNSINTIYINETITLDQINVNDTDINLYNITGNATIYNINSTIQSFNYFGQSALVYDSNLLLQCISNCSNILDINISANDKIYISENYSFNFTNFLNNGNVNFSSLDSNYFDNGTYNITFEKIGFLSPFSFQENITLFPGSINESYNISQTSLIINIYDRETGLLLNNTNVTLQLIDVFTNITNNGTFVYNDLTLVSGQYTLQTSSSGYQTEQTEFDFTNQENLTIDVYLLNLTSPNFGNVFVNVVDDIRFALQPNSNVALLEYFGPTLGYVQISSCITNSNGECVFAIELNTKSYIITASKDFQGQTFSAELNSEIFFVDNEVREVILPISGQVDVPLLNKLVIDINETFVNNVSTINFDFYTTDNTVATVCIEYYRLNLTQKISINKTCYTGSSVSTTNLGFLLNRSNSYIADVYLDDNGNQILETFNYPSDESLQEILKDNNYLAPFILIFLILILVLALYLKSIDIFYYLVTFLSVLLEQLFPSAIYLSSTVIIIIISIAMIYTARKQTNEI
jgi:hypothetical protein